MKIYKISVFILIILIFSVGFAFAEDVKQATSLDDANGEVISDVTVKSYDDLNTALHKGLNMNLTVDYKYNATNDNVKQIKIEGGAGENYIINGTNHIIDGAGKVGALNINNVNKITINNLTLKNCAESSIIIKNTTLILNNVTFMDNKDNYSGAAVYSYFGSVVANDCIFSENYADNGAAINVERSELIINDGKFTNKNQMI